MTNKELFDIQRANQKPYVEAPKYEYEIFMYRYHIEEKLYDLAVQGKELEVKEKMGTIHKELHKKLKAFLKTTNRYENYVEVTGYYAGQYGPAAKRELVQILDRELGIIDNADLHLSFSRHKRKMLYYFDFGKKEYGYIVQVEEEENDYNR